VAFCSEMPFICSSTLRGLWVYVSVLPESMLVSGAFIRVCHGFDGIEATVDDELDVSS